MEYQFYVQLLTEENIELINKLEAELEKLNASHKDPGYLREGSMYSETCHL